MALTLSSEASYLRSAQDLVSDEAGGASRLAWAATGPGIDTTSIQAALLDYLQLTRDREWQRLSAAEGNDPGVARQLRGSSVRSGWKPCVPTSLRRPAPSCWRRSIC